MNAQATLIKSLLLCLGLLAAAESAADILPNPLGLLIPTEYAGHAIHAKIVDAETKQPLSGVMVMGIWGNVTPDYTIWYAETAQYSCDQLVNIETTTSSTDGGFELPAWYGKWGHCQFMTAFDPGLLFYKPGYRVLRLENSDDRISEYTAGANPSSSRWNGQTIEMEPLGHHYFLMEDNYISNLKQYSDYLGVLISRNAPSCFWQEARPAVLLLLEEERRLRAYQKYDFDLFERWLKPTRDGKFSSEDYTCGDQTAYLEDLEREVSAVIPEVAPKPFLNDYGDAVNSVSRWRWWEFMAVPTDELPSAADVASSGILDHGLLYKLDLNPDNPGFMQATVFLPKEPQSRAAAKLGFTPEQVTSQTRHRDFEAACVRYYDPDAAQLAGDAPHYPGCNWIVAIPGPKTNSDWYKESYDEATRTWALDGQVLIRPTGFSAPEVLELDSRVQLKVTTTLKPAGPNRWQLPPEGQDFTLRVQATNIAVPPAPIPIPLAIASRCAKLLPESVRQLIVHDFSGLKLGDPTDIGTSEADQQPRCDNVVAGHFTGDGKIGYAFYLVQKWILATPPTLVVATPSGDGWRAESIHTGCINTTKCRLALAPKGSYVQSKKLPIAPLASLGPPPDRTRPPSPYIGEAAYRRAMQERVKALLEYRRKIPPNANTRARATLTAAEDGVMEEPGAEYNFANFCQDGNWIFVVLDAPSAASPKTN